MLPMNVSMHLFLDPTVVWNAKCPAEKRNGIFHIKRCTISGLDVCMELFPEAQLEHYIDRAEQRRSNNHI